MAILGWVAAAMITAAMAPQLKPLRAVSQEPFMMGTHSSQKAPAVVPIRGQEAWKVYWAKSQAGQPMPKDEIDWKAFELLAIHLGTKSSGGFSVYVDTMQFDPNKSRMKVRVVEQRPGPGVAVTMALTSPYVIVRLPRHGFPYTIERAVEVIDGSNPDPRPIKPPNS